ncbi:MAG: DUF5320 domain-containing protein [Halanaerobiales bacterium]|nr:DUF5320 domain-containing protein [Halanaerobiales bacterium]
MPFGDGTGPMNQGPMTGKGRGYCVVDYRQDMSFANGRGVGRGFNNGLGMGMGRGMRCGNGFRKGMGRGMNIGGGVGLGRNRWINGATAVNKVEEFKTEKEILLQEAQILKNQMNQVATRLEELALFEDKSNEEE